MLIINFCNKCYCFITVRCYNRGNLDKVDQLDDRKITVHSEKASCQSHNYHDMKSTTT